MDSKTYAVRSLPDFTGKKAMILGGAFYGSVVSFMAAAGFEKADHVMEADVVVFVGGVDISPELYGQKKLPQTQSPSIRRDQEEKVIYDECVRLGIPMFGICRGAQFLHAMNGGDLWQHVENHGGDDHLIYDLEEDVFVNATSYHHQMLALNSTIDVIAVCKDQVSRKFHSDTMVLDLDKEGDNNGVEIEIEAGAYHATKCFFVQGHPEVGDAYYRSWTLHKLHDIMEQWEASPEAPVTNDDDVETRLEMWRAAALM